MRRHDDFTSRSRYDNLFRWMVTRFVAAAAKEVAPGKVVLDAGAGECAYRPFFAHCRYIGVDLAVGDPGWNYKNLSAVADLQAVPLGAASVDVVVSTQTLEHVARPGDVLREFYRVLRPGGTLYLTAPMAHIEHQAPHDFWRYTSYGLKLLLRRAGFPDEGCEVKPLGGLWLRWAYELPLLRSALPSSGLRSGKPSLWGVAFLPARLALPLLVPLLQRAMVFMDRFDAAKTYPCGWEVVARKP